MSDHCRRQAFLEAERAASQIPGKTSGALRNSGPTIFPRISTPKLSNQPANVKPAKEELEATVPLPAKPTATK
jgi:hypothetical protein